MPSSYSGSSDVSMPSSQPQSQVSSRAPSPPLSLQSGVVKPAAPIRTVPSTSSMSRSDGAPEMVMMISSAPTPSPMVLHPPRTSLLLPSTKSSVSNSHDLESIHSPWLIDGSALQRVSSPELDTDISRTSSTSTKNSVAMAGSPKSSSESVHTAHSGSQSSTAESAKSAEIIKADTESAHANDDGEVTAEIDSTDTRHRLKRLHSLLELAETEANYVKDLDVLINVFFKLLPGVSYFADSSSRLNTVVRNGPALLKLHRNMSSRLTEIVSCKRLAPSDSERTEMERAHSPDCDEAVSLYAKLFIELAPEFSRVYCEFCSRQKEALSLIDTVEQRPEWDLYQYRASDTVRSLGSCEDIQDSASQAAMRAKSRQRLLFRDFFIKPIQRVCLYPIILQTISAYSTPAHQALLDDALRHMRQVTADVNEASAKRQARLLSEMIISRMEPSLSLSSSFLPSLGDCKMTGNLDVLYHHPELAPLTTPLATKYYGCVLYADFVLMFKARKTYTYQPRYWFPLADVKLTPSTDPTVKLPLSFRLTIHGHHFEMIATTEKERDLWLDAFAKAISEGPAPQRRLHGMDVPFPCNLEPVPPSASSSTSTSVSSSSSSVTPSAADPLARYLGTCTLNDGSDGRSCASQPSTEVLMRLKSPPRRAAKDKVMVFSDACISARSSIDIDSTRSRGMLVGSRVGLHRLSGNETLSLRLSTNDLPPSTSALTSSQDSTSDLTTESPLDSSRPQSLSSPQSSKGLDSADHKAARPSRSETDPVRSRSPEAPTRQVMPRSQSMLGRTLQELLAPTSLSVPAKAEDLTKALMDAFTPSSASSSASAPVSLSSGSKLKRSSSLDLSGSPTPLGSAASMGPASAVASSAPSLSSSTSSTSSMPATSFIPLSSSASSAGSGSSSLSATSGSASSEMSMRHHRSRCSSMDRTSSKTTHRRSSSSLSSLPFRSNSNDSTPTTTSPNASRSLSPRRRLAQRFLQRNRFSSIN